MVKHIIADRRRSYAPAETPARSPVCTATAAQQTVTRILVGSVWFLAAGPAGFAQETQQPAPDVQITVSAVGADGQLIQVAVNKSVLIDFSVPMREVQMANSDIAEVRAVSPRQIIVKGKTFGVTQLVVWLDENTQRVFDVSVDVDVERLEASIRAVEPRAKVSALAIQDKILLTGTVPSADAAKRVMEIAEIFSGGVINQLRVAGVQQVLLRVTVAEVNRSATRQLGINGWIGGDNLHDFFGINQLDAINPINIGAVGDALVGGAAAGAIPFATGAGGLNVSPQVPLSFGFPRVQMQVFIKALHENGLLRVLAEPNLVALSGQTATFLAGGEVPIPLVTEQRIRITFKQFGIQLAFTPTVISEDIIRLHIVPEISEPDFSQSITVGGFVVPSFTSRRVETTIELGSGQTFAISGLLSDRMRGVSRKIPGLGDLPVLGPLFTSVEYQRDRTEFVVLVTPELVEPLSPDQITSVPGARLLPPNDFELYLLGKIEGEDPSGDGAELQPRVNRGTWPVRPSELYGPSAALKVRGPLGPAGMEEGS